MAVRKKRAEVPSQVRRRSKDAPRKKLDPDLEAFARSDEKRFRPRHDRKPGLKDPRPAFQIPGVANRDARTVFEARVEHLKSLDPASDEYARSLAEVCWLELWRGRSVTTFDSFVEDVLGASLEEAKAAARRGAGARGLEPLRDPTIALWMRIESAALEAETRIQVELVDGEMTLRFPEDRGPEFLHTVGRRLIPLVQDRAPRRDDEVPRERGEESGRERREGGRDGRDGRRGGKDGRRDGGRRDGGRGDGGRRDGGRGEGRRGDGRRDGGRRDGGRGDGGRRDGRDGRREGRDGPRRKRDGRKS